MALNWVMLSDNSRGDFIPLPSERTVFKSSHRTSLSLSTPKSSTTYPAHHAPATISISSTDGTVYLTNQRILYLPSASSTVAMNTAKFTSFSCPLLNLHDSHLVMPWFGPNAWTAVVQPVAGGGLPANTAIEVKFTFKDGGAPEFQGKFEAIRERLREVVENAREANGAGRQGVDMANVHLEQLPRYEDSGQDPIASDQQQSRSRTTQAQSLEDSPSTVPVNATADQVRAMAAAAAEQRQAENQRRRSRELENELQAAQEVPRDEPPGYEEAQSFGVAEGLERLEGLEQAEWEGERRRQMGAD